MVEEVADAHRHAAHQRDEAREGGLVQVDGRALRLDMRRHLFGRHDDAVGEAAEQFSRIFAALGGQTAPDVGTFQPLPREILDRFVQQMVAAAFQYRMGAGQHRQFQIIRAEVVAQRSRRQSHAATDRSSP